RVRRAAAMGHVVLVDPCVAPRKVTSPNLPTRSRIPSTPQLSATALITAVVFAFAGTAIAATNADQPHPRLGLYGPPLGAGTPLTLMGGAVTQPLLSQIARYDEVVLSVSPFTEYSPDVLGELRRQNPNIKLYAYIQANYCWPAYQPDSLVNIPTRHYRLIRDL